MTVAELRTACEALAPAGDARAKATLALLAELAAKDELIRGLCDQVDAQSQLLAKRAEKEATQ